MNVSDDDSVVSNVFLIKSKW